MAQDFYWTLNIGTDERHIAPIDEGGVALAAIQAVSEKLKQKDAEIQNLRNRLERLQAAVDRLAAGK
jgi:molecular chaperone GrpE (heat shock protein)